MKVGEKIKKNLYEYKRILAISSKPSREDFERTVKVSAMGIAIIGLMGFIIQLIGQLFM